MSAARSQSPHIRYAVRRSEGRHACANATNSPSSVVPCRLPLPLLPYIRGVGTNRLHPFNPLSGAPVGAVAHEAAGGGADLVGGDDREGLVHGFVATSPHGSRKWRVRRDGTTKTSAARRRSCAARSGRRRRAPSPTAAARAPAGAASAPRLRSTSRPFARTSRPANRAVKPVVLRPRRARRPERVVDRLRRLEHAARAEPACVRGDVRAVGDDGVGAAVDVAQQRPRREVRGRCAGSCPERAPQDERHAGAVALRVARAGSAMRPAVPQTTRASPAPRARRSRARATCAVRARRGRRRAPVAWCERPPNSASSMPLALVQRLEGADAVGRRRGSSRRGPASPQRVLVGRDGRAAARLPREVLGDGARAPRAERRAGTRARRRSPRARAASASRSPGGTSGCPRRSGGSPPGRARRGSRSPACPPAIASM